MTIVASILPFAIAILLCEGVGAFGSLFTREAVVTWYPTIAKPAFTPPPWIFAPVWTLLYALMGIAAAIVWRSRTDVGRPVALAIFLAQLLVNGLWTPAFFGLRSPLAGLFVMAILWIVVAATIVLFFKVSKIAGALLLPYAAWIGFAGILNVAIVLLNSPAAPRGAP